MATDAKLPIVIFAALVALITVPVVIDHIRERRRPVLLEARVVTASETDHVFRGGRRHLQPGESAESTVALRIGRRGSEGRWYAPVERLSIDNRQVEHVQTDSWPETGRAVRVFWFSVECTNLGGVLTAEDAGKRLEYRTFLAPEMGRGLRAERLPEAHNDDHLGRRPESTPEGAGTVRLYARVEVVENEGDLRPLQAVTTLGVDDILNPAFPTILRSTRLGNGVDDSAGELFRLPGFEPQDESGAWDEVTVPAFGKRFTALVEERLVVSSRTLAAVAVAGRPDVDEAGFRALGRLEITTDRVHRDGRSLSWATDVMVGDLLVDGSHWRVLLGDEGNGRLDPADPVLHCWGSPPERTTLWASLETDTVTVEHLRHGS